MKPGSRLLSLFFMVAAAAACGACGGKDDKPAAGGGGGDKGKGGAATEGSGDAAKTPYDKSKATGSLKGVVKFKGTAPPQQTHPTGGSSDNFCKALATAPAVEKIEVNADGTVPHCFVWVSKGPHEKMTGFEPQTVVIDQKGCVYEPHVTGVMVGQTFTIKNSDQTTHNVKAAPQRNDKFNLLQAPGKSDEKSFTKKEVGVALNCDVHSWMSAYLFSLDHPFYATSSRSGGTWTIPSLPAGKYTVRAWHESWAKETTGREIGEFEVKDGQATEVSIELGQ